MDDHSLRLINTFNTTHPGFMVYVSPNYAGFSGDGSALELSGYSLLLLDFNEKRTVVSEFLKSSSSIEMALSWLDIELDPKTPIENGKEYDRDKVTAIIPGHLREAGWYCYRAWMIRDAKWNRDVYYVTLTHNDLPAQIRHDPHWSGSFLDALEWAIETAESETPRLQRRDSMDITQ